MVNVITIEQAKISNIQLQDGEFDGLLQNEKNNLIATAIHNFADQTHYQCTLTKNIPIGAGLGGGSSDAAMVAKFLNPNISNDKLAEIGADLPICYHAKPAFCSGIGEVIEPVTNCPSIYLVLVNPKKTLLTKDVFKHSRIGNSTMMPRCDFADANQLIDFLAPLGNDLTAAAIDLMPEIQSILDVFLQQDGCRISRMSGSGPTCFGIFTNQHLAMTAYSRLNAIFPEY